MNRSRCVCSIRFLVFHISIPYTLSFFMIVRLAHVFLSLKFSSMHARVMITVLRPCCLTDVSTLVFNQ